MTPDPRERFLTLLREALAARTLKRLVLSRPVRPMLPPGFTDEGPVLQRLRIQPVRMRDGVKLAFAWQYDTRDQTDNLSVDEALVRIDALLGDMRTALLETRELTAELGFSKRGRPLFRMKRVTETPSLQDRGRAGIGRIGRWCGVLAAGRGGAHATAQGGKWTGGSPCRG